ncbi:unnamed protein product [Closterium sp. NIES-53]
MIHATAPYFLWLFAVRYAAHQLNLWPRVSEPETSPTLRWTGKVDDASVFRAWGALSLVCDAKASKLSSRTLRCVFLGFPTDAPPWQFYHSCSRRGPALSGVSQVDPPPLVEPLEISSDSPAEGDDPSAVDTAATRRSPHLETPPRFPPRPSSPPPQPAAVESGAETAGAEPGGAETEGEGSGGAATEGAGSGGAATGSADFGGAASPSGGGAVGDPAGGARVAAGAGGTRRADGAGGTRAASLGGAGGAARVGGAGVTNPGGATGPGGAGAASPGGLAGAGGAGAAGTGGASVGGAAGARGAGAVGTGGTGVASPGGARTGGAGAAGAGRAAGAGGAGGAAGGTGGTGGARATGPGGALNRGAGAAGAGGAAAGVGGAAGAADVLGAGGTAGASGASPAGARGAAGAGGAGGARGAGAGGPGAAGIAPRRPFFYPQPHSSLSPPDSVLRQVLNLSSSTGLTPPLLCPLTDQSQPQLLPGSPLPAPAPHTEVNESFSERREPETHASTLVRARRVARPRPPAVPGTHCMALRPSSVPQRVVLPEPPASSLPHVPDPESDLARATGPTVNRLLGTVVTDPDFESTTAFALVTEQVDFAARRRLHYVASLVTESESVCPPSVRGEPALSRDVLEDKKFELECLAAALPRFTSMLLCREGDPDALDIPTPRSYAEAIAGEYSSHWQTSMDAEMASWKSTCTYVDEVHPPRANIVDGMWIFIVKRPPGSPPAFKVRYVARGFNQRQGVDFFQNFSPTPKITTLWVLLHIGAHRDYEVHSFDSSTSFLQCSIHEEIWLCRPPGFTWSFPAGTQWSLRRPVYGLRQAPREWHDTLRTTLAPLGFAPSADLSMFLRTDTSLPPFYVLVYVDDLVFATANTKALALIKAELQERHICIDLGELHSYLSLEITRDRARRTITLTQSHMVHQVLQHFGFQFSSPQPTPLSTGHSLSAPPSDESVEPSGLYPELVGCLMYLMTCTRPDLAYPLSLMACYVAPGRHRKELRWLTYLLADLGERPRSPPTLYVDNKAMLALCCEQRLEHRTKHIALRYFLARELQQRRQLCLSYVAPRANTANVFTKALGSGDHQRLCTAPGLVPILPHLLVA